jgi:hypothetical protein
MKWAIAIVILLVVLNHVAIASSQLNTCRTQDPCVREIYERMSKMEAKFEEILKAIEEAKRHVVKELEWYSW